VLIPNQVVPVFFTLRAQLTTGSLKLSTNFVDFGACCYVTEAYRATVSVANESHLAQKVGFVELPAVLSVQPQDGLEIMLPRGERNFELVFKPTSAIVYDFVVTLRTTMNFTFRIRVKGQVMAITEQLRFVVFWT
jgi:hypothetical protein